MTGSEALDSLDAVKRFAEMYGDTQINVMLNELMGKVKTLKLENVKQSTSICFLRNDVASYHN